MRFHVITLFPEMFGSFVRAGILGRRVGGPSLGFVHQPP